MTAPVKLEQLLVGLVQEEDIILLVESFCDAVEKEPHHALYCHQLPLPEKEKMMAGLYELFSWLLLGKSGEMPTNIYSSLRLTPFHISRQWKHLLDEAIEEQFTGILAELVKAKFEALSKNGSVDLSQPEFA